MNQAYFIGIDIGTQGVRILLADARGEVLATGEENFDRIAGYREEQSPVDWWEACRRLMPAVLQEAGGYPVAAKLRAIAVTSTSGTIIPLDHACNPLHPAIMYSDPRSEPDAVICRAVAFRAGAPGYTAFNSSSGLPKMHWFMRQYPGKLGRLYKFIHAADFIAGRLSGIYDQTDYTNALKSGYDLHNLRWPSFISEELGIRPDWLPQVRPPATRMGPLLPELAQEWHLPADTVVATGMTDGCASQVAAGAVSPGQWNTTIGTTLVVKGVTEKEIRDPQGAIYNHRHPGGYWMPGGASNTGADWVGRLFPGMDPAAMAEEASRHVPTSLLAWPLMQKGERFPFLSPRAEGFWPQTEDPALCFAACMEGVAYIERYAYERLTALSGEQITRIHTAGGASQNPAWLQIRSDVTGIPIRKMENSSGAAGAAILAAAAAWYPSLEEAAAAMVHADLTFNPQPRNKEKYDSQYMRFMEELRVRKFL